MNEFLNQALEERYKSKILYGPRCEEHNGRYLNLLVKKKV